MRLHTHILSSIIKQYSRRLLVVTVILNLCFWTTVCLGANYLEEEKLDRAADILDREWKINIIRLATRDYLRLHSQVKTGLPNYDQLVENTRLAPAQLYEQLTARPVEPVSSAPKVTIRPSQTGGNRPASGGQQEPTVEQSPQSPSQPPPSPPTDISTSPSSSTPPFPDLNQPAIPSLPPGAPTPTLPYPSSPGPSVIP